MTEGLKERPPLLRRPPRPAPDEAIDPVDYSPAAAPPPASTPASAPKMDPEPTAVSGGAVADTTPAPAPAVETVPAPVVQPVIPVAEAPVAAPAPTAPAPARQSSRMSKAAKTAGNRKTSRREVTFPLSTRLSQEVLDILYTAVEEEGISVREAIEQGIKSRWG